MVRVRMKPGVLPITLLLSNGLWAQLSGEWTEFGDGLVRDSSHRSPQIDIEDSVSGSTPTQDEVEAIREELVEQATPEDEEVATVQEILATPKRRGKSRRR